MDYRKIAAEAELQAQFKSDEGASNLVQVRAWDRVARSAVTCAGCGPWADLKPAQRRRCMQIARSACAIRLAALVAASRVAIVEV